MFEMSKCITKISSKGQITIPKEIREYLKVKPGDKVKFEIVNGKVVLEALKKPSESMKGIGIKVKEKLRITASDLIYEMRQENEEEK